MTDTATLEPGSIIKGGRGIVLAATLYNDPPRGTVLVCLDDEEWVIWTAERVTLNDPWIFWSGDYFSPRMGNDEDGNTPEAQAWERYRERAGLKV